MTRNWDDPEYKRWRQEVRRRDKGRCKFPNCKSRRKIQVHHIVKWAASPWLRYEVSNGICLCRKHHDFIKGKEEVWSLYFMRIVAQCSK